MELFAIVQERTADKEAELVKNVSSYGWGYNGRIRVYDNIRAAHAAKTILTKKGVKVAIIKVDLAEGVEVE